MNRNRIAAAMYAVTPRRDAASPVCPVIAWDDLPDDAKALWLAYADAAVEEMNNEEQP
jgi:hypothetical protein